MIDVVIPTVTGREADLARLKESLTRNTPEATLRFVTIYDEPTCGMAWRRGMESCKADYLLLACDDLEMTSPTWAEVCRQTVDSGRIPCPIVRRPDGSLESCGGDMNASACLISEMQPDRTPCDFTTVPFMSRLQAEAIGMIDGHYKTDVYVSYKGRQFGWETVVRHGYEFTHHRSDVKRRGPAPSDDKLFDEALR